MRVYKNAVMDSTRWAGFEARADDIFICTPSKCGTTWTQTIVANLLWPDGDLPAPVMVVSPWIEARFMPLEAMQQMLVAQTHRRFIKSHMPADALPWFPQAKYLVVARDGLDAFMSWCNHSERMKSMDMLNERAEQEGLPRTKVFDGDYQAFLKHWLVDNNFFDVVSTFWEKRVEPNVLLVHYNDLKSDLAGEMHRIAAFLDINVAQQQWPAVVQRCTFEAMREADQKIASFDSMFEGGIKGFLFKGTNGRWREVLNADDSAAYQARVTELLAPAGRGTLGRRGA